ncbi:MAG: archaeal proteasome endopeptidase complex subunit beta [Candidatus Thermoplasmatota archaeon]|nr:archaeal proteasome endopeptidase complex subunit beta [Euryarchaeota archaeon]MBU4070641.1 archaeal proteasome endopeptidase complex subunit beta [Candidatus Thermoplasmatota archaeon]MBU4145136.1 archaeal proteasome endopeptidase complex subunit beta [Candidatus Thermoplasmatota archaeon]MBU4591586.1 archaeal proteasome endopeptidase complex subunit beta [Candidatus Thermoplasmatota archaeon]
MPEYTQELKKGTTTVGITCKDGVVIATEHRATMGTLIAHKKTQKLFKIDDNIGLTVAGLVGDAQTLARYLKAEAELYRLKRGSYMPIRSAATMLANILNGRSYYPYWVQLIVAGVDEDGYHVYSLDAAGGSIPDDYVTTGSGSPYVYGILEDYFKEGLSVNDGIDLAIRGLSAAMKRDSASGNGISVAAITKKEFKELDEAEVNKRIEKMKLA